MTISELKDIFDKVLKEVSIDFVIFGFSSGKLKVLLIRWKSSDKWSLPGGRIYKDEDIEDAANRTLLERTGLKDVFLRQFNTFGKTNRYPFYSENETIEIVENALGEKLEHIDLPARTVSVGYYALVDLGKVVPKHDLFSEEIQWWDIDEVPKLLFDHNEMIDIATKTIRREIRFQPIGKLLPQKFTLNEIHKLFETILSAKLDRRNFHKLITSYDFLIKLDEKRTGVANKAPYLYKFDFRRYEKALKEGISV
ncbi:MAG: NUDIX domain-containing protein [Bacteroidota bacterium]